MNSPLRPIRWLCYPWKVRDEWVIGYGPGGVIPPAPMPATYHSKEAAQTACDHMNQHCDVFNSYITDLTEDTTINIFVPILV